MSTLEKVVLKPMKEMGETYMKTMTIIQKSLLRAQAEIHKGCLAVVEETLKDLDKDPRDEAGSKKKLEKVTIA